MRGSTSLPRDEPPPGPELPVRIHLVRDATLRERLDDAGPLIFVAAICLLLALTLSWSDAGAGVGHLAVWVLFAALCLVAGVASVISYAISRPESEEEIMAASKRRRAEDRPEKPRARSPSVPAPFPVAPLPARPDRSASPLPSEPIPASLPTRPQPSPLDDLWREFPSDRETPPPDPSPLVHDPTTLELDRLWSDLERLRRHPRPAGSGA